MSYADVFARLQAAFLEVAEPDETLNERLRTAAALIARADECAAQIETDGLLVRGSAGQWVQHPLLAEERQLRTAADRIWTAILPSGTPETTVLPAVSARARAAAYTRWNTNRSA